MVPLSLIAFWPLLAAHFNASINGINITLTKQLNEVNGKLQASMQQWQALDEKFELNVSEAFENFQKLSNHLTALDEKFAIKLETLQENFTNTCNELRERVRSLEERLDNMTTEVQPIIPPTATAGVPTSIQPLATTGVETATTTAMPTTSSCTTSEGDGVYLLESGEETFCSNGWTVFQRRIDGRIPDFHNKTWEEYAEGFGNLTGEFWWGLRKLHTITGQGGCRLRVDLQSFDNETAYAEYSQFSVENEANLFRLTVGGYNGTAGDSLSYHNGTAFSTNERDNDLWSSGNCATYYHSGGWWNRACFDAAPNGIYGETRPRGHATMWWTWKGYAAMKFIQMGVRCD